MPSGVSIKTIENSNASHCIYYSMQCIRLSLFPFSDILPASGTFS